jgi:hypothetical protein
MLDLETKVTKRMKVNKTMNVIMTIKVTKTIHAAWLERWEGS